MPISEPVQVRNGTWVVQTPQGSKVFSDGETAYDFYLIHRHREHSKPHGDSPDPG